MRQNRSNMFKVLGVGTRVKIIELLKTKGPLGSKRISQIVGVTPAAVSQHLRVLKQAGLVNSERKGYFIPYRVDAKGLEDCCSGLIEVCTCEPNRPARIMVRRSRRMGAVELRKRKEWLEAELKAVTERIDEIDRKDQKK
ncbi:MAG: metalloregulator ArsR/SmtB family transcription factor [Candidatus Eisenbacteria bacterium]